MTKMLTFRVDDEEAREADAAAGRLGIDRSELLRDALAAHLARLQAETEIEAYRIQPFTDDERALYAVNDFGPDEDWSDWVTWADARDAAG